MVDLHSKKPVCNTLALMTCEQHFPLVFLRSAASKSSHSARARSS